MIHDQSDTQLNTSLIVRSNDDMDAAHRRNPADNAGCGSFCSSLFVFEIPEPFF
jgi:hypothetical protein